MKKKMISLLILGLSVGMVGCGDKTQAKRTKNESSYYIPVCKEHYFNPKL